MSSLTSSKQGGPVVTRLLLLVVAIALIAGCATTSTPPQTAAPPGGTVQSSPIIEESLKNIGIASPQSLVAAENALGESTAGYSNYGLELSYVAYKMIQILYPLYLKPEYQIFPPTASIYPDLFKEVETGRYAVVSQSDVSFLTLIIPPMAVLYTDHSDVVGNSLEALNHAETLNPNSVLPPYLKGFIEERRGDLSAALADYEHALAVDSSCYPAAVGKARILISHKDYHEADGILESLISTIPPDAEVFRLEAEVQYRLGLYRSAADEVTRSLEIAPESAPTLVLSARIYGAQKNYPKALDDLAKAEKIRKPSPEEILLRAQLQKENGNPAAAVSTLAEGVKSFPSNVEISDAYGKALIETGQAAKGGRYLAPNDTAKGADSLELLVVDAIGSKNWNAAAGYVERLLPLRTNEQTLRQAYTIYNALGNTEKRLDIARKLHALDPQKSSALLDYVESLIASGHTNEARTAIDKKLAEGGLPATLSSLYYLRSRLRGDPAGQLSDLRSALLENLENLPALIAMARHYVAAGDLQSARRFAEQVQAFLPSGQSMPPDLAKLMQNQHPQGVAQ